MKRRTFGTGSVTQHEKGYWTARIYLEDGSRVARRRWSEEEAEKALAEMLLEHEGHLGYHYAMPRPFRQGTRSEVAHAIPDKLRVDVFARDHYRCRYCGASAAEARLTIDHHVPRSAGGSDGIDNLLTACSPCNLGKGKRTVPMPPPANN